MNKFLIVISTYNSEKTIGKCLDSAIQDYNNYSVVVVNDASIDGTQDIIDKYNVNSIINSRHNGSAIVNQKLAIKTFSSEDDIIVILDGDDSLYNSKVLSYLDSVYTPDIWLTYGQNISLSGKLDRLSHPFDKMITWRNETIEYVMVSIREYRDFGIWQTSHLKTFRAGLFNLIKDVDLKYKDAEYFKTCCDVCKMFPMLEMAGPKHILFIDKILYVYNDMSNNYNKNPDENLRNFAFIRSKKKYEEITNYRI